MYNSKMFGTQEVLGAMSITETQAGSGNKLNIENPAKELFYIMKPGADLPMNWVRPQANRARLPNLDRVPSRSP